jgi:hypothetical protein
MWPISDRFAAALTDSHEITTKIEVLTAPDSAPTDISTYFVGGSLDISRQEIRRSGTLTFEDDGTGAVMPTSPDALLSPYGNELRVWYGIVFGPGDEELIPAGTLRITKVSAKSGTVTVTCSDRAWAIQGARLEKPYQIAKGGDYDQAIRDLWLMAYPQATIDVPNVANLTPLITLDSEADPWAQIQSMAAAVGYAAFHDPMGAGRMVAEQDQTQLTPVWTYDGKPNAGLPYDPDDWANLALYDMEHAWDTDGVFNAVIATGESTSDAASFRGVAYDLDPDSPTLYGGKFGRRPMFWSSPLITSNGMASTSAKTMLQAQLGLAESLSIPSAPHPALECGDAVKVIRPELGVDTLHVVDHFTLPLRAADGTQQLDTRMRRTVLGG